MNVERPTTEAADVVVDLWVDLAKDQRQHGSHVRAAESRSAAREQILRRIVLEELRVARDDGEIVGFVTFSMDTGTMTTDAARGVVQHLYVAPTHRDSGVGTALLEAAESALRERGADVIGLEVLADNEAARRFYRRHGYDPHRVVLEKPARSDRDSKDKQ